MLTVCGHSQPTLGHFVNGHYAIAPIQRLTRDWKGTIGGRLQPLPLFVLMFTSVKQTGALEETFCSHRQTGRRLCNKIPNRGSWVAKRRRKRGNMLFIMLHRLTAHRVGCSGNTNPTRGGKEQQMHPKEQNDAVNSFLGFFVFLGFFLQKTCLFPCCECRAQTSANALRFGDRCGTQALFDPLHAQQPFWDPGDWSARHRTLTSTSNCT